MGRSWPQAPLGSDVCVSQLCEVPSQGETPYTFIRRCRVGERSAWLSCSGHRLCLSSRNNSDLAVILIARSDDKAGRTLRWRYRPAVEE